ncbi:MAG: rRNA pseudouridine synthase [Pseudomonadota bacterium]|nr:rRNA pseudouridine synthase [Pseudomonadota bacterium]
MSEAVRLDKRVAELARCSREDARQYIEGGWVSVDGQVVEEPQAMVGAEVVEIDPAARPEAIEPATMLLHKPVGPDLSQSAALVVPDARAPDDNSGVRPVKRHFHGLTPLMVLDDDASGLVVVTQDPRVRRRLTEDFAQIEQEYIVEIDGDLPPYGMARLARGLDFQGRPLPPCKVSWQNEVRLRFAIKAVQPGQLRHMCNAVGLEVVAIRRIRIGRVPLSRMPVGQWRYLPAGERF